LAKGFLPKEPDAVIGTIQNMPFLLQNKSERETLPSKDDFSDPVIYFLDPLFLCVFEEIALWGIRQR